ncbi:MAG: hypothetical protein EA398_02340 [Deltaproteobacteria bacterium]|nr:MAG: hypothetical protein EA398_02340 [Deltaproteobacteria bacterium]
MTPSTDFAILVAWLLCLLATGCNGSETNHGTSAHPSDLPSSSHDSTTDPEHPRIPDFDRPRATGNLPPGLVEASGIVQSAWDDDRFWLHNDSSHPPELFAIRGDGTLLSILTLPVDNRDWEDISRGPCDENDDQHRCLYVGEIGDNNARYPSIAVHRIREPRELLPELTLQPEDVDTMHLDYLEGPRDAEALVVDDDMRLWILTKRPAGQTELHTAPFIPNDEAEPWPLEFVRDFSLAELGPGAAADMVTAADWDSERSLLILRLYSRALVFPVPDRDLRRLFELPGTRVPTGMEIQGEAIAWTRDGGYIHVAEGRSATLWKVDLATAP